MINPNQTGRQLRERIADLEVEVKLAEKGPAHQFLSLLRLLRELKLQLRDFERSQWGD